MISTSPPFNGLNIRIPIIIPVKGKGFISQRSGLGFKVCGSVVAILEFLEGHAAELTTRRVIVGQSVWEQPEP